MTKRITAEEAAEKRTLRLYRIWQGGNIQVRDVIRMAFMAGVRHQANKRTRTKEGGR